MKKRNNRQQSLIRLGLFVGIMILLNIVAQFAYKSFDLTEDGRYSVTDATKTLIRDIDERVFITVYLEGEFPAGFRRLQNGTKDLLRKFKSLSRKVDFQFVDPNTGSVDEQNALREKLANMGIGATTLIEKGNTERKTKEIFPAAVLSYKGRVAPVSLLEENKAGMNQEIVLNNAIQQLEYKFANALQKIKDGDRKRIFFTEGNGELLPIETADLQKSIGLYHYTERINLDSITQINPIIDILIVAKPTRPFDEKDKFKLDQFIMNGGKVIWLIDKLGVGLDSLRGKANHTPIDFPLNLDDMFFKYGVRLNTNMVLDLECTPIPLQVGGDAANPQYEMFDWWYHPAVSPTNVKHPIVKGLDKLDLKFPGSIDTIATKQGNIKKSIILKSSKQARAQFSPARVSFEILRYGADETRFTKQFDLGVLLEGNFVSHYQNRVPQSMADTLKKLGQPFKNESVETKMLVIADGDIIKNGINYQNRSFMPLGLNEFANYTFANKDFMLNCIEYMLGDEGLIEARSKELKLRMLNKSKAEKERSKWQFINIGVPLVFLVAFGFVFNWIRRRRFAR